MIYNQKLPYNFNVILKYENVEYFLNASLQPKISTKHIKVKRTIDVEIIPEAGFKLMK